jgi:ATP-dependent DNA helicase RecQ
MPASGSLGETVLIALSGVARAKGRCGKGLIAQMLGGSKSAKMSKLRLDQLTTFGRLGHFKQEVINDLLNELLRMRLIEQEETDRFRPVLQLAPLGWEVIRGQRELDWATALSPSLRSQLGGPAAKRDAPRPAAPKPAPRPAADPFAATSISERPAFYWTWRLVAAGLSPAECQAALGLNADQFAGQLRAAAAAGLR